MILNCIKSFVLGIVILAVGAEVCSGQIKETVQLATLTPTVFLVYSDVPEHYEKSHFMLSTIGYMGSYMVTESKWKAALLTLAIGAGKELIYDELLNKGEPLWSDMKYNAMGVGQGVVFTYSLDF